MAPMRTPARRSSANTTTTSIIMDNNASNVNSNNLSYALASTSTSGLKGYPLQRGSACLSCRKRKMKCDAGKPVCQQCIKGNRYNECEYDDGKTKSRTQMLQEKVSRLQDRIKELETKPSRQSSASPPSPASSTMQPISTYPTLTGGTGHLMDPDLFDSTMTNISTFAPHPHSTTPEPPLFLGNQHNLHHLDVPYSNTGVYSSASSSGSASPGPPEYGVVGLPTTQAPPSIAPPAVAAAPSWGRTEHDHSGQWWSEDDLTPQWRQTLLDIFLPHRHQSSFYVHVPTFLASLNNNPPNSPNAPHPALMNAIYLLATHFAPTPTLSQLEPVFLERALNHLSTALEHSDRLVNIIQASCLLATWFFGKGRLLEGYYHASSAGRLAIGLGLHQIRTDAFPASLEDGSSEDGGILPCATSKLELGERILAFWQVFNIDRCWAVATGLPSGLSDDDHPRTRILTVFPRDVEEYVDGSHMSFDLSNAYVQHQPSLRSIYPPYHTNPNSQSPSPPITPQQHNPAGGAKDPSSSSLIALRAKATALFERASRLSASFEHTTSTDKFWSDFRNLNFAITSFLTTLPPIPQRVPSHHHNNHHHPISVSPQQTNRATLLVIHSLAQVAFIQLHHTFSTKDVTAHEKCLDSARAVINFIPMMDEADYAYLDPIMGTCWMCVSDVLLREQMRRSGDGSSTAGAGGNGVNREIDAVVTAMKCLGTVFPLAGFQVNKVEQGRLDIGLF